MSPVLRLASDLVAIPSVSRDSNEAVADRCVDELRSLGFEIETVRMPDQPAKVSIAAVRLGEGGIQEGGFAYFGHTDVVPADDWTGPADPFTPVVEDGRLYGRGSCDMKGSVAAMLTAAAEPTQRPVWIVLTADEETGFGGARSIAASSAIYRRLLASQPAGIIGEPTSGGILHGHKGGVVWRITAEGKQVHSSFGTSRSATRRLMAVLDIVHREIETLATDATYRDERFEPPSPTPNIRLTDSSPAINVTSASASVQVFARLTPAIDVRPVEERLREAASQHGLAFWASPHWAGLYRDPASEYIRELRELTGAGTTKTAAYGTDGCVLNELDCLAVCGPGSIEQAHTTDEYIELAELDAGVERYRAFLRAFAG